MAETPHFCQHGTHMKSRLCYAWFGDEDVKAVLSSLENQIPTGSSGEAASRAALGGDGQRREIRPEPPRTQPLFKTP
jgi:hypothetical protein